MMKKYAPILFLLMAGTAHGQADLALITAANEQPTITTEAGEPAYELVSFVAQPEPQAGVMLTWSTGAELPNSLFTVQRSRDGLNWHTVLTMDGEGAEDKYTFYQATDLEPPAGVSYYRLLASADGVDLDLSDEFAVDYEVPPALRVAGNEGPSRFIVQGNGTISQLEMLNNRGQFVPMQLTYTGDQVVVNAETLEAGTYFVQAMVDGKWVRRSVVVTATGVFGG